MMQRGPIPLLAAAAALAWPAAVSRDLPRITGWPMGTAVICTLPIGGARVIVTSTATATSTATSGVIATTLCIKDSTAGQTTSTTARVIWPGEAGR